MTNFSYLEIFLIQFIVYGLMWFINDFLATALSIIVPSICFCILIISLIAELLERSKVPKWYFKWLSISILAPIVTALVLVPLFGFELDWLK